MKMYKENFGFNNFNTAKILLMFSIYVFIFVVFLSVGFAGFQATLMLQDISAKVEFDVDVRISGFKVNTEDNGLASNTDYNYNRIYGDILLPESSSSITYEVLITNLGKEKVGVASIIGQNPNLKITCLDYLIGTPISEEGQYTLGITQKILVTIQYADGAIPTTEKQAFNFDFDFKPFYNITYHGLPGDEFDRPTEIMEGEDLVLITELQSVERLRITMNTVPLILNEDYTYDEENDTLIIMNITGDLLLSYRDVVYLVNLSSDSDYFKEGAYKTKIENVEFVNYVPSDLEDASIVKYYDLTDRNANDAEALSIVGWITANENGNYNLYIGSIYDIYTANFARTFSYMTGIKNIDFQNLETSESTSFSYTFYKTKVTNLDLSTFNTSNAQSMTNMFADMTRLETLDVSNFNTAKVTSMASMFSGVSRVAELDISTFDTTNVSSMSYMFKGMSKLNKLTLGKNFNMANVTNATNMFSDLTSLVTVDLSMIKANNLQIASSMFLNCSAIKNLDLSSFDTSNLVYMDSMFSGMSSLETINISTFKTANVTTMSKLFYNCKALTELNLSNFNTSNVTTMAEMFSSMSALTKLNLSSFDTANVTNMSSMFYYCKALEEINFSSASFTDKLTAYETMFYGTPSTITITVNTTEEESWLRNRLGTTTGTIIVLNPDPETPEEGTEGSETADDVSTVEDTGAT